MLPLRGAQVQLLVGELRSHMQQRMARKKKTAYSGMAKKTKDLPLNDKI